VLPKANNSSDIIKKLQQYMISPPFEVDPTDRDRGSGGGQFEAIDLHGNIDGSINVFVTSRRLRSQPITLSCLVVLGIAGDGVQCYISKMAG
jgi:hypothetical protein